MHGSATGDSMAERRAWLAVAALVGAVALWMDFGTLHALHHSDSLIPVLASVQRWTPFFWGQDRFGMLVPLVAMPVRAPLANLLLQAWIMLSAALLAPFLMARVLVDRPREWVAAGALANLLLFLIAAPLAQFDWLVVQPYALSLALGAAALVVTERGGMPAVASAFVLLTIALWVNLGVAVLLAAAVLLRGRHVVRAGALLIASAAVGALLARTLPPVHTPATLAAVSTWTTGWAALLSNAALVIGHPLTLVAAIVVTGVALAIAWRGGDFNRIARAAGVLVGAAAINWLVLGTSDWVRLNLYYPRYMFPSLMMLGVAAGVVMAGAAGVRAGTLATVACAAFTLAAFIQAGPPSPARVSRRIDAQFGRLTPGVVASGAVAIAGDYWAVWPAVFHANVALWRSASSQRVFGLTYRSEATDYLWAVPGGRFVVAGAEDDESAVPVAARHDVVLRLRDRTPPVALYEGRLSPPGR
jgi:hypothetical protein